jgi:alanine racemase
MTPPTPLRYQGPYLEIDLDHLVWNLGQLQCRLPDHCAILAVVKDCAYGCGAVPVAQTLERAGVGFFAVARAGEARSLRDNGISSPILVLGECNDAELLWASMNDIHCALNDLGSLHRWQKAGCTVNIHCNIDTGMGRLGLQAAEVSQVAGILCNDPMLKLTGVFTHFASADTPGTTTVTTQKARFDDAVGVLRQSGLAPRYIHTSNSAAVLRFPATGCNLVRPGIALYGCRPDPRQEFDCNLKPVVRLVARVVKVKQVAAGTPISYGGTYAPSQDTTIATIDIGYAHGLPRSLSSCGNVLIRGKRYRIAGRVTMDYIMVDCGIGPEIEIGDEVVVLGQQGADCITVDEAAVASGTIGYEILTRLSTGIDRCYYRNGKVEACIPGSRF